MSNRPNMEEILKSLDGIQPARPKPFFTTRVMQRIKSEVAEYPWLMTPRFRMAVIGVAVLIAVNILLFIYQFQSESQNVLAEWKNTTPDWVIDYTENPGSSFSQGPNK